MQQYRGTPMRPLIDYPNSAGALPQQDVKTCLSVSLGSYSWRLLFEKRVDGYWIFGADNKLLDIWVYKYADGL
jgi:hypothetical protein